MRLAVLAPALLLIAGGVTAADKPLDPKDQAALDKALAGLVPQRPVACLPPGLETASSAAYGRVLVYSFTNSRRYVNETTGGCEGAARGDVLVSVQYEGRACSGDIIRTVETTTRMPTGSCSLRQFVPYIKPR